jgi:hypothetical protein
MRWARSWMLCAAFYYPALWLAMSCIWAFPALLYSAFFGEEIIDLRVTPFGLMLWSAPSNPAVHPRAGSELFASAPSFWILIPLVAAVAIALVRAGSTRRILGGLLVALLGDVAVVMPFARFSGPVHISTPVLFSSILFFAALCLGIYCMSAGWAGCGYRARLASSLACVAFMPLLLWLLLQLLQVSRFGNFLWMLAPPAAVAAVPASFGAPKPSSRDSGPVSAWAIFSGIALTVLLVLSGA